MGVCWIGSHDQMQEPMLNKCSASAVAKILIEKQDVSVILSKRYHGAVCGLRAACFHSFSGSLQLHAI